MVGLTTIFLGKHTLVTGGAFIPHGHCYLWQPQLIAVHAISDFLIALSYYTIPVSLLFFIKKRIDFPFPNIIFLFGAFILACGSTHLVEIWTLWHASYWASGLLKAITAIISVLTALELIPLIPKALELPSVLEFKRVNDALQEEILERKRVEKALKDERTRYRAIIEDQTELICRFTPDSKFTFVNEAYCQYFNGSKKELIGSSFQPVIFEPDRERVSRLLSLMTKENPVLTIENRVIVNGTLRWTQWNNRLILNEANQIVEIQGVGRDITALKEAEEKLRILSEERLQLALEAFGDGLWDWNIEKGETYFSPQILNLLGFESDELNHKVESWKALIHAQDKTRILKILEDHLEGKSPHYNAEYQIRTKSGQWKWIASYGKVVIRDQNNKPLRMIGVHRDIDLSKQIEMEISQSLEEKKTLLKEIHHRVKNNLQVICSLLSLQSHIVEEQSVKALLQETQGRVKSMALVHEKLYRTESLSRINMADHVHDLLADLRSSFGRKSENIDIDIKISPEHFLNIDIAVPFGLIVNELVSNAFKYAFESTKVGKIWVQAGLAENQKLFLNIRDNGIGLPDDFDIENTKTLGLILVQDLTDQLDGTLTIENSCGASFSITLTCVE
jgi:PAS domain S-box-containing protein